MSDKSGTEDEDDIYDKLEISILPESYIETIPKELVEEILMYIESHKDLIYFFRAFKDYKNVLYVYTNFYFWSKKLRMDFYQIELDDLKYIVNDSRKLLSEYFHMKTVINIMYLKINKILGKSDKMILKGIDVFVTYLHLIPIKYIQQNIKDMILPLYIESLTTGGYENHNGKIIYIGYHLEIKMNSNRRSCILIIYNKDKMVVSMDSMSIEETLNLMILFKYFRVPEIPF